MASDPAQLYLLSDHIKLSLLERQRALALNLKPNTQNTELLRSLESFRLGLEDMEERQQQELSEETSQLRQQYTELLREFDSTNTSSSAKPIFQANDPSLSSDFVKASDTSANSARTAKSVRFRDNPSADSEDDTNRATLFPYRDDPSDAESPDHNHLDNQQIHEYHSQVIQEQDQQLDRLGASIGRQRELSIAIGDELDEQAQLLDDVDDGVTRHQSQIDRARKRVGKIARKAKDNLSVTIILSLIIILILLIVITK